MSGAGSGPEFASGSPGGGDPELEQRLDAAFASLRPRAGFQEELWLRLQPRRSRALRLLPLPAPARRPALAWTGLGALAAVLVGLLATSSVLLGGLRGGGAGPTLQARTPGAAAPAHQSAASALGRADQEVAAFGRLPTPILVAGPPLERAGIVPYFGPARLTVSAVVPRLPATLTVWRFAAPGGVPGGKPAALTQGASQGSYREPLIRVSPPAVDSAATAVSGTTPQSVADEFLRSQGLYPTWPFLTRVLQTEGGTSVVYVRLFEVVGLGPAEQVDQQGEGVGAEVLLGPGLVVLRAAAPLPAVTLVASAYPARDAAQAARDALTAPATGGGLSPLPVVDLSRARLVYQAVDGGDGVGYFEPALLFTGTFRVGSTTFEKRVLVPALEASQLR